jgi:hypothetical protein
MQVSKLKVGQLLAVRRANGHVACCMALVMRPKKKFAVEVGVALRVPRSVKGGVAGGPQRWEPAWVYPNQIIGLWADYERQEREKQRMVREQEEKAMQAQTRFQSIVDALVKRGISEGVYVDRRYRRINGVCLDFQAAERLLSLLSLLPEHLQWEGNTLTLTNVDHGA